jgi:hypothetical protein
MEGAFWTRHRELDNKLLRLFMHLPEQFRLPQHIREPVAIHTNLNLHASVICLHHAAIENATKYNLPETTKQDSISRIRAAADEIASIIKLTVHNQSSFRSPLCAVALYSATTSYVYVAKYMRSTLTPIDVANMDTVIQAMGAIGQIHKITRAFLQQVCLDVELNDLTSVFKISNLLQYRGLFGKPSSHIPLFVRSPVSSYTKRAGFVPSMDQNQVSEPASSQAQGTYDETRNNGQAATPQRSAEVNGNDTSQLTPVSCFQPMLSAVHRNLQPPPPMAQMSNKRKRVSPSPVPDSITDPVMIGVYPRPRITGYQQQTWRRSNTESWGTSNVGIYTQAPDALAIPDRTNSTASSSPQNRNAGTETLSASSHTSPGMGLGNSLEENRVDLRWFIDRIPTPIWQAAEDNLFGQMDSVDFTGGLDPWDSLHNSMYPSDDGMLR